MALTRSAGRAQAPDQGRRRNPSRRSRASFSSTNDRSDESTLSDDDSNTQAGMHDTTESDAGGDAGGSSQRPSLRNTRSTAAAVMSGKRRSLRSSPRRSTRIVAARVSPRTKKVRPNAAPVKRPSRSATKKNSGKGSRSPNPPPVSPTKRHEPVVALRDDDQSPQKIIPDWQDPRIPYEFWTNVFLYAGGEGSTDSPTTNWLLRVSTTCAMFAEPALAAIYRCPVIKHAAKAKRLVALLERDPFETRFNYRAKIEYLHIDIQIVPPAILYQLIHPLTRLKELVVFTPMDQPPYRELDTNVRWHYPEDIFRALGPAPASSDAVVEKPFPTYLKSWEWSGRLIGGFVATIADIARIHQTPPFSHLTRLSFTNFQVPSLRNLQQGGDDEDSDMQSYREDGAVIEAIADAISQLTSLRHLVFESSTVMSDRLLPLLPRNLVHLELINCWEIKSEDLAPFLRTHGSNLRTLTLLHNQSLDLGFLMDLADACPNLRELHMNLSYFRHHDSVNDADPMYDFALLPDQVPKWPSSLRVLNIEHIRNWPVEAAEMFLQSLIDNSHRLLDLRHLAIKTMLDIPWQARAAFRIKWRSSMERVFLRPFEPPRSWPGLQEPDADEGGAPASRKRKRGARSTPPSRRSGRIAAHGRYADSHSGRGDKLFRSRRGKPLYREPDTDEDEFDVSEVDDNDADVDMNDASRISELDQAEPVIQGLCHTVSILFDNQKVREMQYGMQDFLTDEDGDDSEDEWNGDDNEDDSIIAF